MTVEGVVRYPERTTCVQCGALLAPGSPECPTCFPGAGTGPANGVFHDIERHLRRSRARLLFGFLLFPPLLPWAVLSARRAGAVFRRHGLVEAAVGNRIRRHLLGSLAVLVAWLAVFALTLTR